MKRILILLLAAGVGFTAASLMVSKRQAARHAAQLAEQQAVWQAEKAELEAALAEARANAARVPGPIAPLAPAAAPAPARLSPHQIIARLQALRPTGSSARSIREAVYWLEELSQAGPAALPAIRECLARNQDLDLDTSWFQSKAARGGNLPGDFLLPPSLRFGLFEVARQIGGADAEKILSDTLGTTGRGVEVAYLTRQLHELAPNKYRDQALGVARELLVASFGLNSPSALDRNHRDFLYGVLMFYSDTAFSGEAQSQLVRADSQVDRSALKYLQHTLGAQAVPIVAQAYQNPALTNSAAKEPLARLALNYVGADSQANEFYQRTINDPILTRSDRKNLIEDLNQDGFADTKNLTANDLPLIQNRLSLIEQLAPTAADDANAAAFKEAYKDLINMRDRILRPPAPAGNPAPAKP